MSEEVKEMQVITVNPEEYGIDQKKSAELMGTLPQVKAEREALEAEYAEVQKMDIEAPETQKAARALRLKIKDNRTKGIEAWHKSAKEFFLAGGRFVDAIRRVETEVNQRMEAKLQEVEDYAEIQEAKRMQTLREERSKLVEGVEKFIPGSIDLGKLSGEEFDRILKYAKQQHQDFIDRQEAERKEQERLEKINLLHNERKEKLLPVWSFLPEEAKGQNLGLLTDEHFEEILNKATADLEADKAERERIRKENEKLAKQKQAAEEAARKEREEAKRKFDEAEAKRKEAEAQLLKETNERIAREKQAAEEAEKLRNAPIKEQMTVWLKSLDIPEELLSLENETVSEIFEKYHGFQKWALSKIETL